MFTIIYQLANSITPKHMPQIPANQPATAANHGITSSQYHHKKKKAAEKAPAETKMPILRAAPAASHRTERGNMLRAAALATRESLSPSSLTTEPALIISWEKTPSMVAPVERLRGSGRRGFSRSEKLV